MTADEIIARLVAALQDVEFVVRGEYSVPTCASCGGIQTCGHDAGCIVREAIAAAEAHGRARRERPPVRHASDCNLSLPPSQAAYGAGCTCGAPTTRHARDMAAIAYDSGDAAGYARATAEIVAHLRGIGEDSADEYAMFIERGEHVAKADKVK